jgi:hypothetical protein
MPDSKSRSTKIKVCWREGTASRATGEAWCGKTITKPARGTLDAGKGHPVCPGCAAAMATRIEGLEDTCSMLVCQPLPPPPATASLPELLNQSSGLRLCAQMALESAINRKGNQLRAYKRHAGRAEKAGRFASREGLLSEIRNIQTQIETLRAMPLESYVMALEGKGNPTGGPAIGIAIQGNSVQLAAQGEDEELDGDA